MRDVSPTPRDDTRRFLQALGGSPDAKWYFQTFDDSKAKRKDRVRQFYGTLDNLDNVKRKKTKRPDGSEQVKIEWRHGSITELAELNQRGAGIYVTVNETDASGFRNEDHITRVRALFVDLDGAPLEAVTEAEGFPEPSAIVQTSPKRYHCYWFLACDLPLADFPDLQKRLAERFGGDPTVCDLPRVMRLPGFDHCKGERFPVKLQRLRALRYELRAIEAHLPELPKATPRAAPAVAPPLGGNGGGYHARAIAEEAATVASTPEGGRNHALNRASFKLGGIAGCDRDEAQAALVAAAVSAGLPEGEALTAFQSGWANGCKKPRDLQPTGRASGKAASAPRAAVSPSGGNGKAPGKATPEKNPADCFGLPLTELGAARRLARLYGDMLRHSSTFGWYHWTGKRWKMDATKQARRYAAELGGVIRAEGKLDHDNEGDYKKFAKSVERNATLDGVLKLAADMKDIDADHVTWDMQDHLLNCLNGTLDLATGELREHNPSDRITKLCPTRYDPGATCPRWLDFLHEIFAGDGALIEYIRWLCGYALTGNTKAQEFWVFHGKGKNGKSVFLNVLRHVLGGDYTRELAPDALMQGRPGDRNYSLAGLPGARLVSSVESSEGQKLNVALLKSCTGGDPIEVEAKYVQPFTFTPKFKLIFVTNHRPQIPDTTESIWRRLRLIPFTVWIPEERRDHNLDEKLQGEAPGILSWAVEGLRAAGPIGEKPAVPECVEAATKEYKDSEDVLSEFLREAVVFGEGHKTPKADMLEAYKAFTGNARMTAHRLTKLLREHNIQDSRTAQARAYDGLALRAEYHPRSGQ